MASKYNESELGILKRYVDTNDLKEREYDIIKNMILTNPPVSITVYRGHNGTRTINNDVDWFSTTTNKQVALTKFTNHETKCCLFTIHLINVQVLFINKSGILISSKNRSSEDEVIVLGGGKFYKNEELTEEGFDNIEYGEYECWYTFPKEISYYNDNNDNNNNNNNNNNSNTIVELFSKLDPDEYEYIDNKEDVKLFLGKYNITDSAASIIFNMINELKKEYQYISDEKDVKFVLREYNITDSEASIIFNMINELKKKGTGGKNKSMKKKQNRNQPKRKHKKTIKILRKSRRKSRRKTKRQ
jgi:hypothetical protein